MDTIEDVLGRIARTFRIVLAVVAFLGISNATLLYWMLEGITGNSKRIEVSRAELIDRIGDVREQVVALNTALGESPEQIMLAARSVERSR